MQPRSFTLLEIIVVIVIIGILATLGVVNYGPIKEKVLDKEAVANLKLIRAAERIYRMETNNYIASANTSAINSNLRLSIPTGSPTNWNYKVDGITATTFTGKAQRNVTAGRVWCINQDPENEDPYQTDCSW